MIDLTDPTHTSTSRQLDDALVAVRRVLDMALDGVSVTGADMLACAIAAVTLGEEANIQRTTVLLRARALNYCAADVSAAAARDFALAYRVLADQQLETVTSTY
jgi:hypothetical protein